MMAMPNAFNSFFICTSPLSFMSGVFSISLSTDLAGIRAHPQLIDGHILPGNCELCIIIMCAICEL